MDKIKTRMKLSFQTPDESSGISNLFSCVAAFIVIAGIVCCAGKFLLTLLELLWIYL
jgi:hypothetical protein